MTIERILIAVLFLLNVRTEIEFMRLAKKHNGLTTAFGMMAKLMEERFSGFMGELDSELKKHSRYYREQEGIEEDD